MNLWKVFGTQKPRVFMCNIFCFYIIPSFYMRLMTFMTFMTFRTGFPPARVWGCPMPRRSLQFCPSFLRPILWPRGAATEALLGRSFQHWWFFVGESTCQPTLEKNLEDTMAWSRLKYTVYLRNTSADDVNENNYSNCYSKSQRIGHNWPTSNTRIQ